MWLLWKQKKKYIIQRASTTNQIHKNNIYTKRHEDNNVKYSVNASSLFATSFVTNETN